MPELKGKKYAYTKKGKEAYKKALAKSKEKKLKKKLAEAGNAFVYHPSKKGEDPKSIRDIGHMRSKTNEDQGEYGHMHNEGLWNTPSSKHFRSTIPKKMRGHKYRLTKRGKIKYYDDSK